MAREPISEELRRFILTSVPSVPFVEAMLLFRDARGTSLGADFIARRLYISESAAAEIVNQLRAAQIVQPAAAAGWHCFTPATPELARLLEELAKSYGSHLVEVTKVIHSNRARNAQQFADAFKLRKDS